MSEPTVTGVYVERNARTTPRWVAVVRRGPNRFDHVTLSARAYETSREDALELARTEAA